MSTRALEPRKSSVLNAFIHQLSRYSRSWMSEWVKKMRQMRR
jgi:hypothetical protein